MYRDKLLVLESMTAPFVKTITWIYDNSTTVAQSKKANLTRYIETADNVSHITDMVYDVANFNLMTSKSYSKDANTTIVEEFALRADRRLVEMSRVLENGEIKEATGFSYDSSNRLVAERQYFNAPQVSALDRVTS